MKIKRQCFGYFKHDSLASATAKHENAKGEDNCIPENKLKNNFFCELRVLTLTKSFND